MQKCPEIGASGRTEVSLRPSPAQAAQCRIQTERKRSDAHEPEGARHERLIGARIVRKAYRRRGRCIRYARQGIRAVGAWAKAEAQPCHERDPATETGATWHHRRGSPACRKPELRNGRLRREELLPLRWNFKRLWVVQNMRTRSKP